MSWITEMEAAQMLQRKPRTLRAKVKAAVWPITFTAIEGRKFQYSKQDIEKLLSANSNKIKP